MVEYNLDTIFGSLSDGTRRDILRRIIESRSGLSVGEIAKHYTFSLAAIAKHLNVLEKARLVRKTRNGKEQIVTIETQALTIASDYLETYKQLWEDRLDSLDNYFKSIKSKK